MPALSVANAALMAASVMSFARCISAISAGDLIMRHPAVTGVARHELAAALPGAAVHR